MDVKRLYSLILLTLATPAWAANPAAERVCRDLNAVRQQVNSPAMTLDDRLSGDCMVHARACATRRTIFHSDWQARNGVKEGVCFVLVDPVYALATKHTPGHREDAIDPLATRLGVGWAYDDKGTIYWVLQYGKESR